ncbi:hypothetical protein [Actinophytocola algeriensis]|uniref:Capsular polysaccharide biosynthesis protein n=1 Tax=Actinophytocola algeriensis TaxID=1768010 RepID=A0A7W7Q2T8_9PSEU|nr:hypothetical protein [Actinophytocola algeriensis]MBB4905946.1 hypothetical protein [Actinophytocola algeriensis]MBE1472369.1 hypothetical protein [Actinophytocola algeriensis]
MKTTTRKRPANRPAVRKATRTTTNKATPAPAPVPDPAPTTTPTAAATVHKVLSYARRPAVAGLVAAVLVGLLVLLVTELRGDRYQARVGLLAEPAAPGTAAVPQYGEVVALTLPALVELARSPSVVGSAAATTGLPPDELSDGLSVELVPASGLARLAVIGPSAEQSGAAATAIARAMIDADLLAPAGALRLLDERPDITQVAPDRPLGLGLALAAAAVAGVATGALRHLRRGRAGEHAVHTALAAAGVRRPVTTLSATDPELAGRLRTLCDAAARPVRVVPVAPDLAAQAEALAGQLPGMSAETSAEPSADAVVVVARAGRRQDELGAVAGVLPGAVVVVAVVLA